jgi:DNA invertase Pin-like site-specific DNA recombinase
MTIQGRVAIYLRFGSSDQLDGDLSRVKSRAGDEGYRAALYIRVPQGVKAVDSGEQYGAALEYCNEHAYILSEKHIYEEDCSDEALRKRPALTRLREDARKREFDVAVIYSYECLAHEQALVTALVVELEQYGIRTRSIN